jgi:two-component system sensor histidine kinase KdpD
MVSTFTSSLKQSARQQLWLAGQYFAAFCVVILVTLILYGLKPYLPDTKTSLFYLLVILGCALVAHPGVTFFCGLLSFLCYDFFLVPPYFDLRFAQPWQVLDPLAFLFVAVFVGTLAERARQQANERAVYQRADQLRATLLHLVSHNLRNPLAIIKTAISTLNTSSTLDEETRQILHHADCEVDHLARLVTNVLQLSRLEANALQIHKRWDALDEVINSALARWSEERASGALKVVYDKIPALVQFDFELIEAVLTNLIDNAFRHGHVPIKVHVSASTTDVIIAVEDCGTGVLLPDRNHLFENFYNVHSRGIGLGLAVCKGLIEAHGGQIWAEFKPNQTRFIFTLPSSPIPIDEESLE